MKKFFSIAAALVFFTAMGDAQVVIAPPTVFITDQLPFGTFMVSNVSPIPQEVDISFRFGYPGTDSLGTVFMDYSDSLAADKYSCADWINGFPTKFILNPGQEQVVHMSVSAPDSLADGVYWTRLITVSQPQQKFVDTIKAGISANIIFLFSQVTSVLYEKGNLATHLNVDELRASQDSTFEDIFAAMERSGDAPFLGTISINVSDQNGTVVYSDKELVAVYLKFVKRFSIPLSKLPPGNYSAEIKITSDRPDIPPENQLKIAPISRSLSFAIK